MWHMVQQHSSKQSKLLVSVGNKSLKVEFESSLESMMPSPESSPSLFVQRLESSRVNLRHRLESSRVSLHTDESRVSTSLESTRPIKLLKILTCGSFHIQFYYKAICATSTYTVN